MRAFLTRARSALPYLLLAVLLALPVALLAQADSSGTTPPATGDVLNIAQLVGWGAAIVGAWLFKKWNVAQGKLDGVSNFLKAAAATALVTLIGVVATKLGTVVTGTGFDLTQAGLTNFVAGLGSTILVHFGITSAKEKATAPKLAA